MVYVSIQDLELFKLWEANTDKVTLGMIFDEFYLPEMNWEHPYHVRQSVVNEMTAYLKHIDVHVFPIFIWDFPDLISICS